MPRIEWGNLPPKVDVKSSVPLVKPTIHNVFILDTSPSMNTYNKFKNAKEGLLAQIEELRKDTEVDHTFSVLQFSSYKNIKFVAVKIVEKFISLYPPSDGFTALNDAIGIAISTFMTDNSVANDKVIFKIFTDGDENDSAKYSASAVSTLIQQVEQDKNWVVTFIGTENDVKTAIKLYGIEKTNTLVHNNTGEDITRAMSFDTVSTQNYSKRILSGDISNTNFYNNNK